jgi:hypothetical protein
MRNHVSVFKVVSLNKGMNEENCPESAVFVQQSKMSHTFSRPKLRILR